MTQTDVDSLMWVVGVVATIILVATLVLQGLHRTFPIFTAYLVFQLASDPAMYWVHSKMPGLYFDIYFIANVTDYLFQLCVLWEIGLNVVRPVKRSLPHGIYWILAGILMVVAGVTTVIAIYSTPHWLAHLDLLLVKLNLGMSLLRLGIFVAIALFAQVLGIGWKNHVLQLATGLAFYSALSLVVTTAQSRDSLRQLFHPLSEIQVAGYLGTLAFWIWSFAREEAPRKEFSPQMQNFLVSIAGSTRSSRIALQSEIGTSTNRER
jgi:hypothetical protein